MQVTLNEDFLQQHFQPSLNIKAEYNTSNGRIICYCGTVNRYQTGCLEVTFDDNGQLDQLMVGNSLVLLTGNGAENTTHYFQVTVRELITGKPFVVKLSRPEQTDIRAWRCSFRCDVTLPFWYIDEAVLEFEGEIKNLSAGGLLGVINFDSTLKVDDYIEVQFNVPSDPKPLRLTAQIVRIVNLPDNQQEIAVQFTSITEAQQNRIIKYLFICQRKARGR